MSNVLEPFRKVINETTTEIIDGEISKKVANVVSTLVKSVFEVVDDALLKVQDLTKEKEPE